MTTVLSAPVKETVSSILEEAERFKYNDRERSFHYSKRALELAEVEGTQGELIHALLLNAYNFHHKAQHELFFKTIERAVSLMGPDDTSNKAYAFYLNGCCFRNLGDYSSSAENFIQGLHLAEGINDTENLIRILNGLGHLYHILGDNQKALENLERGLQLIPLLPEPHLHANLLGNQAEVFIELKRFKEAMCNLNTVASIYQKLNDLAGLGVTRLRLGKLHYACGETEDAVKILTELYDQAVANDFKIGITVVGGDFASILIDLNRIEEAEVLIDRSISVSREINYHNNEYDLFFLKYRIAVVKKDFECALHYYEKYQDLKEKTLIREAELKLKNAESLSEIQLVKKEAELNRLKHVELRKAYEEIEVKNKEITDSIRYARRIQTAILPAHETIASSFSEHFIMFQPRNIVSGDFYWFKPCVNSDHSKKLFVVADCTGHGVPGSLMSMIGTTLLNQVIISKGISEPSEILEELDKDLCSALKVNITESRDGMDIAVVLYDETNRQLHISSAMRPVYIQRKNTASIEEVPATKRSIGGSIEGMNSPEFKTSVVSLSDGDRIYLFTDGYADQFGGARGKKLMLKNFKSLLSSSAEMTVKDQGKHMQDFFCSWKGDHEQVDDVTLVCLQVK